MMEKLSVSGAASGKTNVSFLSYFVLGDLEKCLEVLIETQRLPEAAFFARTYLPSALPRALALWKEQVAKISEKASKSLADPEEYPNLFPNYKDSLEAEQFLKSARKETRASDFPNITV